MKYSSYLLKFGAAALVSALLVLPACAAKQQATESAGDEYAGPDPDDLDYAYSEVIISPPEGDLSGNTTVFGGTADTQSANVLYGAYTSSDATVSKNTVTISGGVITDSAYGAYTEGVAKNNTLTITAGKVVDRVEAGHGRTGSLENKVYLHGGSIGSLYGGYSSDGPADKNFLQVTGGRILDDAQGGLSLRSSATGNTVQIDGGVIEDQVYGGYGMEGPATGNTAIVTGGIIKSDVNGAVSSTHNATGNTVILRGSPQIGRSIYGAFAVDEYGDGPDDITGNRVLLEGFNAKLGDIWNAEEVKIDKASRLANRDSELNFYNCRKIVNDGVIAVSARSAVFLESSAYSGKGLFELERGANIEMRGGALDAPLRIKLVSSDSAQPFSRSLAAVLSEVKYSRNVSPDKAVQLAESRLGGLTLTLEREKSGSYEYWYVSGR